ncbi:MAG TPA: hypothetical protein VH062_34200 [Polyangiaceae bacterium]|jgi:hypothetical protein|nr:hypothetical protein [Polyangiaceae bacterium]
MALTKGTKRTSAVEVFELTPGLTLATTGSVAVAIWRSTTTVAAMKRVEAHLDGVAQKHPRFSSVIVLESIDFRPPEQPARQEFARLTAKFESTCFGIVTIAHGSSAKSSLFRFVLSTLQLISSPKVPQEVFNDTRMAANWLANLDPRLDATAVAASIEEARALKLPER